MNLDSRGFETRALAGEAVQGWKNSPGHRDNLLLPTKTEIGVAVVRAPDKNPKFISVQLFGRPESPEDRVPHREPGGHAGALRAGRGNPHAARRAHRQHTAAIPSSLPSSRPAPRRIASTPRNGDRFVVRAGAGGAIAVERK